jgi:heme exporter protein B
MVRGMSRAFAAVFLRDVQLTFRLGGGGVTGLMFFLMVVTLMPFALGPDLNLLSRIGPAILWIAALFSTLIGLDRLFQADEEDGALDLLLASPLPLELSVLAKCLAHWVSTSLPLVLVSPVFGLLLAMNGEAILKTGLTLCFGTPALVFIGALGAALTATLRRGGLILAVLVLPFMIPVLIFGVAAASGSVQGESPFLSPFLLLVALTLISMVTGIAGACAALRRMD